MVKHFKGDPEVVSQQHKKHIAKNMNFNYKHQLLKEKASLESPLSNSLLSLPATATIAPIYNKELHLNYYTSIPQTQIICQIIGLAFLIDTHK